MMLIIGDSVWRGKIRASAIRREGGGPWHKKELSDSDVARVTLRLDALVTARRQAKAAWLGTHALPVAHLPTRPDRLELAVLTALAQVLGSALMQESYFLPVLDAIASRGGGGARAARTVG
jgi:hypothetical protein